MQITPGLWLGTDIVFPAAAFKNAMGTAAIYGDGLNKTDIKRLVYIPNECIPIYGVRRLRLDVMRQDGMSAVAGHSDAGVRSRMVDRVRDGHLNLSPLSRIRGRTTLLSMIQRASTVRHRSTRRSPELGKGAFGCVGHGERSGAEQASGHRGPGDRPRLRTWRPTCPSTGSDERPARDLPRGGRTEEGRGHRLSPGRASPDGSRQVESAGSGAGPCCVQSGPATPSSSQVSRLRAPPRPAEPCPAQPSQVIEAGRSFG